MLKNNILSLITRYAGKQHNLLIDNKSFLTSNFYKSKFSGCIGNSDFPIIVQNSRLVGNISIGEGTHIVNSTLHSSGNIKIGNASSLNGTSIAQFINRVEIGNYCSIAAGTKIVETNHRMDRIMTYHYCKNILKENVVNDLKSNGDIIIEDDVWIGSNVVILSGVHIGRGSVIGAGCVVNRDVPSYSICVGVPEKCIKRRFSDSQIAVLEKSKWWELKPEELREKKNLLKMDIADAVKELSNSSILS